MKYHDKTIKHNIFHNDGWAKTKETSFITATIFTPAHRRIRGFIWINFLIQWKSTGCRSLLTAAKETKLWMKFTILFLLKPTKQCLSNKRPVCIMSCNSLMMSRVPAATSRACTLSAYVGGGFTVNSPGFCTFIYCWEMLIVATASLCVGTGAVPVLNHGLKTAAGNEEKKGRGKTVERGKEGNTLGKNYMAHRQDHH